MAQQVLSQTEPLSDPTTATLDVMSECLLPPHVTNKFSAVNNSCTAEKHHSAAAGWQSHVHLEFQQIQLELVHFIPSVPVSQLLMSLSKAVALGMYVPLETQQNTSSTKVCSFLGLQDICTLPTSYTTLVVFT